MKEFSKERSIEIFGEVRFITPLMNEARLTFTELGLSLEQIDEIDDTKDIRIEVKPSHGAYHVSLSQWDHPKPAFKSHSYAIGKDVFAKLWLLSELLIDQYEMERKEQFTIPYTADVFSMLTVIRDNGQGKYHRKAQSQQVLPINGFRAI